MWGNEQICNIKDSISWKNYKVYIFVYNRSEAILEALVNNQVLKPEEFKSWIRIDSHSYNIKIF